MDRGFLLKFAGKNLSRHRLRTTLTVSAMVIGVSAIVFLVAFAFGIERLVSQEISGGNAFELIDIGTGNSQIIKLNDESVAKIRGLGNVKQVEMISNLAAKVKTEGSTSDPIDVSFFGTTAEYMSWSGLQIYKGKGFEPTSPNVSSADPGNVVVNTALLSKLSIADASSAVGKTLSAQIIIPKEIYGNGEAKALEEKIFVITGVVKDEAAPNIYINYKNLVAENIKVYSQAKASVSSRTAIDTTRKEIENLGFKTEYVGDTLAQVEQIFSFFKIILGGFGLIALIVASLGMFNTLTISLLERTKEVALLKILGMKRHDILKVFLSESLIMGFLGGIFGISLGIILSKITNTVLNNMAMKSGGDPTNVFYFPAWFMATVFIFSVLTALLTGLYPAYRATRVNALDVLRYE